MDAVFMTVVLGAITTLITQISKKAKVADSRIIVVVISLAVSAIYAVINGVLGAAFLDALWQQGVAILTMASLIYGFLYKQIDKLL